MAVNELEAAGDRTGGTDRTGLSDAEKLDWIRLIRTERIGPVTFHELISHFASARAALDAVPELSGRGGLRQGRAVCSLAAAEREWDAAERAGMRIIAFPETDYPPLLRQAPGAPPLVFAKGHPRLAAGRTVAIVGSRHASAAGRQFAGELAKNLGGSEIAIVSGLARGIDTAAHEAALSTGTVGVVAGGIDIIYPPENAALHQAIAERGLLLSECPPGFAPRGQDFPRRNRIISGVSSGVVVVEAAQKSGSLITARFALEQNREVFAVPGHPLDPRAAGTNALIKSGAHLATSADDIICELFGAYPRTQQWRDGAGPEGWREPEAGNSAENAPSPSDRETVLALLSIAPVHPDILLRQAGLSPRCLAIALLELDLAGRIDRHDDERVSLRPAPLEAG